MDSSRVEELVVASRRAAFLSDPSETLAALDRAIVSVSDPGDTGRLLLARALAQQGRADMHPAAADARASVRHLVEAEDFSTAAFATACAAGMVQRTGDTATAIDLAVDALVLLPNTELLNESLVRAANAMAMLFTQLCAFELALSSSRRAFQGAMQLPEPSTRSVVAYTLGYCATAAARSSGFRDNRAELLTDLDNAVDWLSSDGAGAIERAVLGSGMRAERLLLEHLPEERDTVRTALVVERSQFTGALILLEHGAASYPDTAPRLAAWHQLVTASVLRQLGQAERAETLLNQAVPELAATGDEHRVLRAYNERSAARAVSMDLMGALDDAREVARLARDWQQDQVGRLALQISRRAELEQARSQLRGRADELARQASEDHVTGLGSRRWLEMRMDELARSDGTGTVIVLDLDRFKQVNDNFGHQTGDEVLRRVGEAMRSVVRADDLVARFGGEEFVVLMPGSGRATGRALAERIRTALGEVDWESIASGLTVTISAGVAEGPLPGVRELLRLADTALYEAKRSGRDRVVSY